MHPEIPQPVYPRRFEEEGGIEMLRPSILAITLIALAGLTPVHATTQTITFSKTITFDSIMATVSGSLTVDTTAKTLLGTVTVNVVDTSTGTTIFSKTFNINLSLPSSNVAMLVLATLADAVSCRVDGTTGSASCMLTRNPDLNFDGVVNIIDFGILGSAYSTTIGSARFNPAADLDANGRVDIIDAGIMGADYGAKILA